MIRRRVLNEKLAVELFDAGAIKFGSFPFKIHERYSDFPLSPNKVDLRNLSAELVAAVAYEMWKKAKIARVYFDLVVGLPKAGEPFAEKVANILNRPLLKMAKEELANGKRRIGEIISGSFQPGQAVLGLDDVMSQGESKGEWIARVESAGLRVAAIIVGVDREEGGSEYIESLGYPFYSLYYLSDLLKFYHCIGKISQQQLEKSLAYSQKAKQIFLQNIF